MKQPNRGSSTARERKTGREAGSSIKSMTGFGQGSAERDGVRVQVELKGVNHRFLDVKMKLPQEFGLLEPRLRALVQERVSRGRIDVAVTIASSRPVPARIAINRDLIEAYVRAAAEVKRSFRLRGSLGLEAVLALPGAVAIEAGAAAAVGEGPALVAEALGLALDAYDAMRAAEGRRLLEDLRAYLAEIGSAARRIEDEARGLPETYARRLKERVAALLEGDRTLDESRLAQEVALLAGRVDVTEEVARLRGYVQQAETTLASPRGPAGKTLDFIMQEMNREANTISSKAESLPICREALRIKAAVEKIREQVQNLE